MQRIIKRYILKIIRLHWILTVQKQKVMEKLYAIWKVLKTLNGFYCFAFGIGNTWEFQLVHVKITTSVSYYYLIHDETLILSIHKSVTITSLGACEYWWNISLNLATYFCINTEIWSRSTVNRNWLTLKHWNIPGCDRNLENHHNSMILIGRLPRETLHVIQDSNQRLA